jgi:serine/threonine protein kinase
MSPEVIRQQQGEDITYNKSCDVWGLGVIVYIMLSGEAPFDAGECGGKYCGWREGDNCSRCLENLQDEITDGHLTFDGPQWKNISGAAKDLLGRMLVPEEGRISAANILRHPWVRQIAPSTPLATPDVLRRPSAVDFFNSFATGANITNRALLDGAEDGELLHRGVSMLPAGVSKSSMMERRQRRAQASQALSSFSTVLELDLEHVTTPHFRPLAATKSG